VAVKPCQTNNSNNNNNSKNNKNSSNGNSKFHTTGPEPWHDANTKNIGGSGPAGIPTDDVFSTRVRRFARTGLAAQKALLTTEAMPARGWLPAGRYQEE